MAGITTAPTVTCSTIRPATAAVVVAAVPAPETQSAEMSDVTVVAGQFAG
jgi:hypothetical protein